MGELDRLEKNKVAWQLGLDNATKELNDIYREINDNSSCDMIATSKDGVYGKMEIVRLPTREQLMAKIAEIEANKQKAIAKGSKPKAIPRPTLAEEMLHFNLCFSGKIGKHKN